MSGKKEWKKIVIQTGKIAVGSSAAIYIAQTLGLENAASAGTITLLTIVTTKRETLKLSAYRLITFAVSVLLAAMTIGCLESVWIAYAVYIFAVIFICQMFGWQATISVNSVIGIHFLTSKDFSLSFIFNEFLLVFIGITIAVLLNLFHDYKSQEDKLIQSMRDTEERLQMILGGLAAYLSGKNMQWDVWNDIRRLEQDLEGYIKNAYEYQGNSFQSHPGYYTEYFEMRLNQLGMLHNLHYEVKKIRSMPRQAMVIADYILYMMDYVVEVNSPDEQIARLEEIFADMKKETLPESREEFEARAVLYHILMDIEEFLLFKKRFVESLDEKKLERYWKKDKETGSDVK